METLNVRHAHKPGAFVDLSCKTGAVENEPTRVPKLDRIRTCYMQARLVHVTFGPINNADVRRAFGLKEEKRAQATRIIKDVMAAQRIKPMDENASLGNMRYIPFLGIT